MGMRIMRAVIGEEKDSATTLLLLLDLTPHRVSFGMNSIYAELLTLAITKGHNFNQDHNNSSSSSDLHNTFILIHTTPPKTPT